MKKILLALVTVTLMVSSLYAQTEIAPPVTTTKTHNPAMAAINRESDQFIQTMNADKEMYGDVFTNKMGDGVINAASCWTEVPKQITKVSREENVFAGSIVGFAKGIVAGIARGAAGIYDMATFGLPPYDKPAIKPAYKVENPNRDGLKLNLMDW